MRTSPSEQRSTLRLCDGNSQPKTFRQPTKSPRSVRFFAAAVFLLSVVLLSLAGCRRQRVPMEELVLLIEQPPRNIDPRYATTSYDFKLAYLSYARLVSVDDDALRPKLELAERIDVVSVSPEHGMTLDVTLRSAKFSDGQPVTADDVISQHFRGRGNAPTVTTLPGVGAGAAILFQGTDAAFTLQITVSSGTPNPLAKIQFSRAYDSIPSGLPAPGNLTPLGAAPPAAGSFYWSSVAADAVELATATTLPDGVYLLSCVVVQ